jgi:hypothetical protein
MAPFCANIFTGCLLFLLALGEATDALVWGGAALRTVADPPNSIAANAAVRPIEPDLGRFDFGTAIAMGDLRVGLTSSAAKS